MAKRGKENEAIGPDASGALPSGWSRQSLQLPAELTRQFREAAAEEASGGVKGMGCAAIALLLGLPPHIRDTLLLWADVMARQNPKELTPENAYAVFEGAARRGAGAPLTTRTFVEGLIDGSGESGQTDDGAAR